MLKDLLVKLDTHDFKPKCSEIINLSSGASAKRGSIVGSPSRTAVTEYSVSEIGDSRSIEIERHVLVVVAHQRYMYFSLSFSPPPSVHRQTGTVCVCSVSLAFSCLLASALILALASSHVTRIELASPEKRFVATYSLRGSLGY